MAIVGMNLCHADQECVDRIMKHTRGLLWTPGIYAAGSVPFMAYSSMTRWFRRYARVLKVDTAKEVEWKTFKYKLHSDFWNWFQHNSEVKRPIRAQMGVDSDSSLHRILRGSILGRWFKPFRKLVCRLIKS